MNKDGYILIPQIRSIGYFPPVITWVNYLTNKGFRLIIMAHKIDRSSFTHPDSIVFVEITGKPYPKTYLDKALLKLKSRMVLWRILRTYSINLVWVVVWDFKMLKRTLSFFSFKGKIIYHCLEFDPNNFKFYKQADQIIVPEENRSWLSYFLGGHNERPWIMPNIPVIQPSDIPLVIPRELQNLIDNDKIIVFYSGLIDFTKRCLNELFAAIGLLDDRFHLVLMPNRKIDDIFMNEIIDQITKLGANGKVHFIDTVAAPHHLQYIKLATISIGLYRPVTLNQVYAAPNRIYESTAFAVPVILPNFPQFNSLQNKYPFGVVTADPESIEDIKNKIERFGDNTNLQEGRVNAKKFFDENGDYTVYADAIIKRIAGS